MTIASICVYCGSGPGTEPVFTDAAHTLGRVCAQDGVRIVYGGGSIGLMGAVSKSALAHGGRVTGIIPRFLMNRERPEENGKELIITADMHERKRLMFEQSDAFVALPGGLGTLEETVEVMTWAQIGNHTKPILLANIGRFWNPLLDLLDHMRCFQFIRVELTIDPLVANRAEDILPILRGEMEGRASIVNGKRDAQVIKNF